MTMEGFIFLANAFNEQFKAAVNDPRFNNRDVLLGTSIALAAGFALFFFVYLKFRKKSNKEDRERLSQIMKSSAKEADNTGVERRRKRRRRRAHRPRNPSLEKTGGLPPPRPDDQLPKY